LIGEVFHGKNIHRREGSFLQGLVTSLQVDPTKTHISCPSKPYNQYPSSKD